MVNVAIYELILIALMFLSPESKNASVRMITPAGETATLSVVRNEIPGQFEGAHEYLVTMIVDGRKGSPIRFGFTDNLLYKVSSDDLGKDGSFELDMAPIFEQINMKKIRTLKQEFKSESNGTVVLQPAAETLDIILKDRDITLRIDKKFLRK